MTATQYFEALAGTASLSAVAVGDSDNPANTLNGRLVSGSYFDTLGVHADPRPRYFPADDVNPGGHPVVVISYGLWRSRFHGDPSVIGQNLRLGAGQLSSGWGSGGFEEDQPVAPAARDFTIIGVMQPGFIGETVGERGDSSLPP